MCRGQFMKKRNIIALVVAILLLATSISVIFIVKDKKKIPPNPSNLVGNTAGNLYNGGYFCERNGYVYFSNSYDGGALYRMRPNESEMEKLISTETKLINVDDHNIFYYMSGSGSGEGFGYIINMNGISRADLDGSNAATLDKSNTDSLLLLGNSLLFDAQVDGVPKGLRKLDINTHEVKDVIDHKIAAASAYQGQLYYNENTKNFYLNSYNPMTDQITTFLYYDVYQPVFDGNTVYFIDIHNGYALSSYSIITGEITVLDPTRTDLFNVSKSYIYYQTSGKNPQLKRVSLDGSSMDVIKDGVFNSICITSKYVYFKEYNNKVQTFRVDLDGSLFVQEFTLAKNVTLELKTK